MRHGAWSATPVTKASKQTNEKLRKALLFLFYYKINQSFEATDL